VSALVQAVSMPATICDYLEIRKPDTFAGPSLWPLFQGKEEKTGDFVISSPTLSAVEMKKPQPTNRASITDGNWLLVTGSTRPGEPGDKTASVDSQERMIAPLTGEKLIPELYDLRHDPRCLKNVISDQKERAADLHRRFVEFLRTSPMRREHLDYF